MKALKYIKKNSLYIIGIIVVFAISSPFTLAQTNDPAGATPNNTDSIHRYNALQGTVSYLDTTKVDNTVENNPVANTQNNNLQNTEVNIPAQKSIMDEENDTTLKYNYSKEQITNAMNQIQKRNTIGTMLWGTDSKVLKFQIVQLKDQINDLNNLMLKTDIPTEKNQISTQIEKIAQDEKKVENFLLLQQNRFSFFGWFVSML